MTIKVYRHGDIVFRVVENPPAGARVIGSRFEQHGETGKMHVLDNVDVLAVEVPTTPETAWEKFVRTYDNPVVTHPEHPPLHLPPNQLFKVERVRSETPYID